MARRDREPRLAGEPREERLREPGALDGIRSGGDLVEQHERAVGRALEDRDEVPDVAREGREAHRDRLLVADVCEHLVEDGQLDLVRGRPQPALVEHRRQAERLQGDGLAAGVRAGDHDRAQVVELEVDRHRLGRGRGGGDGRRAG